MGAWGTGIFSDDTASDVRSDYNELLQTGLVTDEEAEQLMFKEYKEVIDNEDEESAVFWFAMAKLESDKGRLSEHVKEQALKYLDSGIDLERWEESDKKSLEKRKAVLKELRTQITGPQSERKKIRVKKAYKFPYKKGDILAYKLPNSYNWPSKKEYGLSDEEAKELFGLYVILQVIGIEKTKMARVLRQGPYSEHYISFALFDWLGNYIPLQDDLSGLNHTFFTIYRYSRSTSISGDSYPVRLDLIKSLREKKLIYCGYFGGLNFATTKPTSFIKIGHNPNYLQKINATFAKQYKDNIYAAPYPLQITSSLIMTTMHFLYSDNRRQLHYHTINPSNNIKTIDSQK